MQDPKETPDSSKSSPSPQSAATPAEGAKKRSADKSTASAKTGVSSKSNTGAKTNKDIAKKSSKLTWVLVLLVLVLGIGAYGVWQYQQIKQQLHATQAQQTNSVQQLQIYQDHMQGLQQALDQQDTRVQSLLQVLHQELASTQAQNTNLALQLQQLQDHTTFVDSQVSVKEVESLLIRANQRLLTEQNPALAIPFIHAAQDLIKRTKVLGNFDLLEAIAIDLAALESVAYTDAEDAYVRLSGLIAQTNALNLSALNRLKPSQPNQAAQTQAQSNNVAVAEADKPSTLQADTTPTDTPPSWPARVWRVVQQASIQALTVIGQELKSLVTIRQRNEADKPQISIAQESWQRTHLQQLFLQAQTALLHQQQIIYDNALQQAQEILTGYAASNARAEYMRQQITTLQELTLVTQVPDLEASLAAVATWQANFADMKQDKE